MPLPASLADALRRQNLPSLDGLRAVAVFLVVLYHFGFAAVNGGQGVLIFFVISGFLITWLLLKEEEKWGDVSLRLFYVRRTLRIFPAFYAFWCLVVAGFLILGRDLPLTQALATFFYVSNYYQAVFGDPNSALSHTWSLAIEEQFYLLWPAAFLALRWRRRTVALAIAIVAVWVYRTVAVIAFDVPQGWVYEALDMRIDHLLIGCLLAAMLFTGTWSALWHGLCRRPAYFWVTAAALALSSAMPSLVEWRYRDLIGFTIDPLLVAILIVQGLAFSGSSAAWLNAGLATWLGRMSYSIYLYQQITVGVVRDALTGQPMAVQLACAIAVCLAASATSYYLVERPFLRLKERLGARQPAPAVAAQGGASFAQRASALP